MNLQLFNFLYQLANYHWLVSWLVIFLGKWLPYFTAAAFLVLIFLSCSSKQERLYWVLVSAFTFLLSREVIVAIIHFFYYTPRPFKALSLTPLINHADTSSLPSSHAVIFFALAVLVYFLNKKYFGYFFISAVLIGLGRVAAGVHWPVDILMGAVLGLATAAASVYLLPYSFPKKDY